MRHPKRVSFTFWAGRHSAEMQSYLRAMLQLAPGEAGLFLQPEEQEADLVFHLMEGLIVGRKPSNIRTASR